MCWRRGGARLGRGLQLDRRAGACPAGRVADMAGSRLPRQLFLQGVAAVFLFAFASLYTQIPGEGAERGHPPTHALCGVISPPDTPLSWGGSEGQALMCGVGGCGSCPAGRRVCGVGELAVVRFP